MVATDFLKNSLDEHNRKIYNILGDKVEPVTQFLAANLLQNQDNDANIQWLTKPKVMWRFASSMFIKRDIFNDHYISKILVQKRKEAVLTLNQKKQ